MDGNYRQKHFKSQGFLRNTLKFLFFWIISLEYYQEIGEKIMKILLAPSETKRLGGKKPF